MNTWNDSATFRIIDPHEGMPLSDIERLGDRALSLAARNSQNSLLRDGNINIRGAIEMLTGMEYHFANFMALCDRQASVAGEDTRSIDHEAVAYLNRLGQFYWFAKSTLVKRAIADVKLMIPTILKFLVFRNKHAAHRSLDAPHKNDTDDLQWSHAQSLSTSIGGWLMTPRPGITPTPLLVLFKDVAFGSPEFHQAKMRKWAEYHLTYHIYDAEAREPAILNEFLLVFFC